jgi:hypothetical protein
LEKVFAISKEDEDFQKDIKAKNKIEEYFPEDITFHKLTPTEWNARKDDILQSLPAESKTLLLFDNIFKHSPGLLANKEGLDFIIEVTASAHIEKVICGLLTHTVEKENELSERKRICNEKHIPIERFLILSKKRSERALQFADGIKKALLNTSCELIKKATMDLIKKAQESTLKKLEDLDAYAFDHIIINSSFTEGVWEPETIFRINNFLFNDNAKDEILRDGNYRENVNKELETARGIGRINVSDRSYDDHLSLRNQELYEGGNLINKLNSPIQTGDIFQCDQGVQKGKYILVTQQCDLMVRSDTGERKSTYGTLLKIDEVTESALEKDIQRYLRKDVLRPHYFSDKFKLPYFDGIPADIKVGIVDFNRSILVDMTVLDLAVFNPEGECKIDFNNLPTLATQLQSSWRKRLNSLVNAFKQIMEQLEAAKPALDGINQDETKAKLWISLMPTISFVDKLGVSPSYDNKIFDFGIKRIKRFREPNSTILLNKYTKHLSRDAEEHDFAL